MNNTIVVTSIYQEFWGTEYFKKSCEKVGLPVYNAFKGTRFTGNGDAMKMIYEAYVEMKNLYQHAIYSDGADTFFLKSFQPPSDRIIYSAEKAVWPATAKMKDAWDAHYGYNPDPFQWCYLNGGNCCGPIPLLIEFYERYGLTQYAGKDINGQGELAYAFIQAVKDGFPIELDTRCKYFQSTAFEHPGDFYADGETKVFKNIHTDTEPCVLHGNGRTDMTWIYQNLTK